MLFPTAAGSALLFRSKRSLITIIVGILFLLSAGLVVSFVVWIVVSNGLEYGYWAWP